MIAWYRLPAKHPGVPTAGEMLPEWSAVRAAQPKFAGHEQPQRPGELGYCDVRDAAVREQQAALAREYGVSGFCYVLRFSASDPGLDPTLTAILESGRPDFPFCVCWETTTHPRAEASFDSGNAGAEPLYGLTQSAALVRALLPLFADRRYLRIDGRPLFVVSSAEALADAPAALALWRAECARAGVGAPFLACCCSATGLVPETLGFDATIEYPPLGGFPRSERARTVALAADFAGDARSYRSYVGQMMSAPRPWHTMFRSVMPGWDETPRAADAPKLFLNANPETFGFWVERAVDQTRLRFAGDQRLLFVRAWNEWDAGCHLEPDARWRRGNLEALRRALRRPARITPERPSWAALLQWSAAGGGCGAARVVRSESRDQATAEGPRVSVVMPAYNHERYVVQALDSVLAQSYGNLEIIVVDDGSTDATGAILDDYVARCRARSMTVVHQANAGAHEAINHGLALARGEVVALMNSDDLYASSRLERLLTAMDRLGAALAFSATRFIDDQARDVDAHEPYARGLRKAIAEGARAPDPLYLLISQNIAISTGNLVFRRALLEATGGFCAMQVCHDWDFVLAASYATKLAFVDEPLYFYRLHGANTVHGNRVRAVLELEQVQARFFSDIATHPLLRDPAQAERFLERVRRQGLGGFLPRELKLGRRDASGSTIRAGG